MMEKNKIQNLSELELDQLMNRAFLNLDFNAPLNQQLVESIGKNVLLKTNWLPPLNKIVFNKVVLLLSAAILTLATFLLYKHEKPVNTNPPVISEVLTEPVQNKTSKNEIPGLLKNEKPVKIIPAKKEQTKNYAVDGMKQEKIILNGYVKKNKDGERLAGVAIYKQHSDVGVISTEQGYYSLQLPKGEHIIVVSLSGYQTYTFSVYSEENLSRDIELKEVWKLLDEVTVKPEGYLFPNLTEKQKKANEKEKQNMAKTASKLRPGKELKYSFIPAPADKSCPAFYMGGAEVSNLEYRTFLFDLLINGRKEEFLIAKPEQDQWINAGGVHLFDTLRRIYFSDKKYNSYPVVNISVAGAEMYCNWLGELVNEIRQKENKPRVEIRLPYEKEWLHAASAGHPDAVYPWFTDSIQNRVNWFLANCCIKKQTDKFKYPLGHPSKYDQNAYTSAGLAMYCKHNDKVATVEVWCYNPNDFYLYAVCGNASELVYTDNTKTAKTKGGNWNSDFEHLKFNSEDEFKDKLQPSPMIGFRIAAFIRN